MQINQSECLSIENRLFLKVSQLLLPLIAALGENCIKIISDKSNSLGMFLEIQTDIPAKMSRSGVFYAEI